MNLPHNLLSKAAEVIAQHYQFNKLPGNAEVYYTITCLQKHQKYLDKQDTLLKLKLTEIGVEI